MFLHEGAHSHGVGGDGNYGTDLGGAFAVTDGRELRSGVGVRCQAGHRRHAASAPFDGIDDHRGAHVRAIRQPKIIRLRVSVMKQT
jgi:hypothetical protein